MKMREKYAGILGLILAFSLLTIPAQAASIEPGDIGYKPREENEDVDYTRTPVELPSREEEPIIKNEPIRKSPSKRKDPFQKVGRYLPEIIGIIGDLSGPGDSGSNAPYDFPDYSGGDENHDDGRYEDIDRTTTRDERTETRDEPRVEEERKGEKAYAYIDYYDTAGRKIYATKTVTGIDGDRIHADSYIIHIATFRYLYAEPSSITLDENSRKTIRLVYEKEQSGSR